MLSASRQIATQRLGSFLASAEATVSSISLRRQSRSHMFRSGTTGTLTQNITTNESEFPWCEIQNKGVVVCIAGFRTYLERDDVTDDR